MVTDPTIFWMAVILAMGAAYGWLLREHLKSKDKEIEYLKAEGAGWKRLAFKGADVVEKAVDHGK